MQTFRTGGKGGQNRDKRDTGVRFIHPPSGARGECQEHRKQGQNKKVAFERMASSPAFRRWLGIEHARRSSAIDSYLDDQMRPENLLVEYGADARR